MMTALTSDAVIDQIRAAAEIRGNGYAREHGNYLRAARLLNAAADGGAPIPPSRDEEALFQAVDGLEALPEHDAFAVLASEVPSLRMLEHQVVMSSSEPGWQDRDADDRVHEIVEALAQLVGRRAPGGSPLIRSHTAFGHARVHLLGKAGLLADDGEEGPATSVPDAEGGQAEETDLLALLARGYGVRADLFAVAKAISKRVVDHPTHRERSATAQVLGFLLQKPGIVAKLRRGDGPSGFFRKLMTTMVRFAQAAAGLRPAAHRQETQRPGLGRPRRRDDHRVPRSSRNRAAQHHQDPQPAADRDPVAVHLRGTAPP
jgi:hypothetical protein